jgi:hypothetical protein
MVPNKNCKSPRPADEDRGGGTKTRITGPVLDRLIKEKIARMPECDGVSAMPVSRSEDASRGCNWVVPGYVGDGARVSRCELAIRDYIEFLASQFELQDE